MLWPRNGHRGAFSTDARVLDRSTDFLASRGRFFREMRYRGPPQGVVT